MSTKGKVITAIIVTVVLIAGGVGFYFKGGDLMGRMVSPKSSTLPYYTVSLNTQKSPSGSMSPAASQVVATYDICAFNGDTDFKSADFTINSNGLVLGNDQLFEVTNTSTLSMSRGAKSIKIEMPFWDIPNQQNLYLHVPANECESISLQLHTDKLIRNQFDNLSGLITQPLDGSTYLYVELSYLSSTSDSKSQTTLPLKGNTLYY